MQKPPQWIMIAGPYTSGSASPDKRAKNLHALNQAAFQVFQKGHVPLIGVNMALPVIEAAGKESFLQIMMPLSLEIAKRCDAVLRIGGPSEGADREVAQIQKQGGVLYQSMKEIPSYLP